MKPEVGTVEDEVFRENDSKTVVSRSMSNATTGAKAVDPKANTNLIF